MTAYFVSRHQGALDWALEQGIKAQRIAHLDPTQIAAADVVMGTLPIQLACAICDKGARYLHLELDLPPEARGMDLTTADMKRFGARLTAFHIKRIDS